MATCGHYNVVCKLGDTVQRLAIDIVINHKNNVKPISTKLSNMLPTYGMEVDEVVVSEINNEHIVCFKVYEVNDHSAETIKNVLDALINVDMGSEVGFVKTVELLHLLKPEQ